MSILTYNPDYPNHARQMEQVIRDIPGDSDEAHDARCAEALRIHNTPMQEEQ